MKEGKLRTIIEVISAVAVAIKARELLRKRRP